MTIETVEKFICPECGAANFVRWSKYEKERMIPCLTCYCETTDLDTGELIITGGRLICTRGLGVTVTRNADTFEEV